MKTSQSSDRRRDDVCDDYFDRGRDSTPAPRTSRELNARSPLGLPLEWPIYSADSSLLKRFVPREMSLSFSLSFSNRKNTRTNPVIRMFQPVSSGKRNYSSFIINLEWEDIVIVKYLKIVNMLLRLPLMFLNETISSKTFPIYIQEQI